MIQARDNNVGKSVEKSPEGTQLISLQYLQNTVTPDLIAGNRAFFAEVFVAS